MRNSILFKLLPGMLEDQTNFWDSIVSVSICKYSYDQRNDVLCNSVIEELRFHCVNAIVRNYLSCSRFQQLVNFSL